MDDYTLPLSSAEVLQPGKDITLLSWGAPLYSCVEAINMLRSPPTGIQEHVPKDARQAQVELIDLRTILPWDRESGYLFRSFGLTVFFTRLTAYATALFSRGKIGRQDGSLRHCSRGARHGRRGCRDCGPPAEVVLPESRGACCQGRWPGHALPSRWVDLHTCRDQGMC